MLFPNHEAGLKLYKDLKSQGIKCTITPAPREATTCCGIALLIDNQFIAKTKAIIEETEAIIERTIFLPKRKNALRDKFC